MSSKPKILFKVEAGWLATGYSNYGREMLNRWHKSGKYDVAEMAVYACEADAAQRQIPWPVYPVMPNPNDAEGKRAYDADTYNQFGKHKFEEICLKFKPNIVVSIDDKWMSDFIVFSPFKPHFKFIHMPTVDAAPQADEWINMYVGCDGLFAYNEWSLNQLKEQGGPMLNLLGEAPPAADTDVFRPMGDKEAHKAKCGLPSDSFIIGTIMRNQKRKLFSDLIRAFSEFLQTTSPDIAAKSWLYLHTCYPDNDAWKIPALLKEFGVLNKTILTYQCDSCNAAYPQTYHDVITNCASCGNRTSRLVHSSKGIKSEALASIINCFDVYVQLATCEGFGIPQLEAAACGVPVLATDYSAMEDVIRKIKGVPIPISSWTREVTTGRYFALPSIPDLIAQFNKLANQPQSMRIKRGFDSIQALKRHYNWDKTAKKWEDVFDSIQEFPKWDTPPNLHNPQTNVPANMMPEDIVKWGILYVLGRPEYLQTHLYTRMVRDLYNGITTTPHPAYFEEAHWPGPPIPFTVDNALQILHHKRQQINHWEGLRAGS